MQPSFFSMTAQYQKRKRFNGFWKKITLVLSSVVVFCTTYALILPAITMEPDYICGHEAHIHEAACYQIPEFAPVTDLVCDTSVLGIHEHTSECFDENGEPKCGIADFVLHTHIDSCFDAEGDLACTLPEVEAHVHGEDCWQQPHVHEEACYTQQQGDLLCAIEEGTTHTHEEACFTARQNQICEPAAVEPHTHGEGCWTKTTEQTCQQEETEGHLHGEGCYDESNALVCLLPEIAGHTHTDDCYQVTETFTCTLEGTEGHVHGETCFETVLDLTCQLELDIPHTHTDVCYSWSPVLSCVQLTAEEGAVPVMVCEEQELYPHTHSSECFAPDNTLICKLLEVTEHIHEDACFVTYMVQPTEQVLICQLEVHEHTEDCVAKEEAPAATLPANEETLLDDLYCGLVEHEHQDGCFNEEDTLMCTMTEHEHDWICELPPSDDTAVETPDDWEADLPELYGHIADDLIAVAKSQLGYSENEDNYILEDKDIYYYNRYSAWWNEDEPYTPWNAKFVSFCLNYADIDFGLYEDPASWFDDLQWNDQLLPDGYSPIAADLVFFDLDNDESADRVGIIAKVDNTAGRFGVILERRGLVQQVNYDLDDSDILGFARIPGNEPPKMSPAPNTNVQNVIALIDIMPSADEIDAQLAVYEENEDYDGMEEWYTHAVQQVAAAYHHYVELSDAEKALVTNANKLLELEYIWSVATLDITQTVPVYMVNKYDGNHHANNKVFNTGTVLFNGGSPADYSAGFSFDYWTAIVVEQKNDGSFYVARIETQVSDKSSIGPVTDGGFVLLIWQATIDTVAIDASVGDAVSAPFDRSQTGAYTGSIYGNVTFSDQPILGGINSDPVNTVQAASTSDFVELNVFDYYGTFNNPSERMDINYRWKSVDEEYPGFQWNGGAYPYRYYSNAKTTYDSPYGWIANRNLVDCIDFGNSLITDYAITESLYVPDQASANSSDTYYFNGTASSSRISVASSSGANGKINAIVWGNNVGRTDRPAGLSSSFGLAVGNQLGSDGYPELYNSALYGNSLKYLFYDDPSNNYPYADKKNSINVDGLFQYNVRTGEYWFDSRENHAQFNDATDEFVLYDQTITPNFILYPFGNFLPFNDITDSTKVTQVSAFNYEGGVKDYIQSILDRMPTKNNSQIQLFRMLTSYKYNWMNWSDSKESHGRKWDTIKAADAINDYFNNSSEFSSEGWDFNTDPSLQPLMAEMYNIDYDVPKNFFFGMDMKMNFMMPKNGITGPYNDQQMIFHFEGDDDVWVYIDDVLFLDLTGIHRHVGGQIDFVNGVVNYYAMDSYVDGTVENIPFLSIGFEDIVSRDLLRTNGTRPNDGRFGKNLNGTAVGGTTAYTFKDYTTHSFHFFYMERGSGSSVCRINFNFPLLRKNSISVNKKNTANIDLDGSPDYYFNIMAATNNVTTGLFVGPNSATGIDQYKIMDSGGNILKNADGTDQVFYTDAYGIFKLKAGQTAVFEGIPENKGTYYVQELIKADDNAQYSSVTINGVTTRFNGIIEWDQRAYFAQTSEFNAATPTIGPYGSQWYGRSGYDTDSSANSTFYFEQNNHVDVTKLGSLSISKIAEEYPRARAATYYKLYVEFGGEVHGDDPFVGRPLPVGTEYTVNGTTRTVNTPGIIEIASGETAVIANVLSGTQFMIRETEQSAQGFVVSYETSENGEDPVKSSDCASGVIRVDANVQVTVHNSMTGAEVEIPLTKSLKDYDGVDHDYTFIVEKVADSSGADDGEEVHSQTITVKDGPADTLLQFSVKKVDITDSPAKLYYRITEAPAADSLVNDTVYIAEVSFSQDSTATGHVNPTVTAMWVGTMVDGTPTNLTPVAMSDNGKLTAVYENTLVGKLTLSKIVSGVSDTETAFAFTVKLTADGVPVTGTFPATGLTEGDSVTFDAEGVATVTLTHGQSVTINQLPYGAQWEVVENLAPDSIYIPTFTVTHGGTKQSEIPSGSITSVETEIVYTNSVGYELPETGGTGFGKLLFCGGMMMAWAVTCLCRKTRYRGRRVHGG